MARVVQNISFRQCALLLSFPIGPQSDTREMAALRVPDSWCVDGGDAAAPKKQLKGGTKEDVMVLTSASTTGRNTPLTEVSAATSRAVSTPQHDDTMIEHADEDEALVPISLSEEVGASQASRCSEETPCPETYQVPLEEWPMLQIWTHVRPELTQISFIELHRSIEDVYRPV